jgi:hypothetical protein
LQLIQSVESTSPENDLSHDGAEDYRGTQFRNAVQQRQKLVSQ